MLKHLDNCVLESRRGYVSLAVTYTALWITIPLKDYQCHIAVGVGGGSVLWAGTQRWVHREYEGKEWVGGEEMAVWELFVSWASAPDPTVGA